MGNVRPPADDSHLHSDPAELARLHERLAQWAFVQHDHDGLDRHERCAKQYRRMAARGDRVPNF